MSKSIVEKIKAKPKAFYKKLIPYWTFPLTYSVVFKDWYVREEGYRIEEIVNKYKHYPAIISEVSSIVSALEEKYPDTKYDYGNETYLSLAYKLYKNHKEAFIKYLRKKGPAIEAPDQEQLWKELVYRGFIAKSLRRTKRDHYYVVCAIGDLIFPRDFETEEEAQSFSLKFGISGIMSIEKTPKTK